MATKLDKPITRELLLTHQQRHVLVTLIPAGTESALFRGNIETIEFRLKGTQQTLRVSLQDVFRYAMRAAATGAR
jgi:hypothetical protein